MKRMIYQVYVGKRRRLYDHCTNSVKEYCKEHGIDHVVQRSPILMIKPDPFMTNRHPRATQPLGCLPIFEKECAFSYWPKYDQIAIIDSDIWIRPGAPNIFDELDTEDFGGAVERQMPLTKQHRKSVDSYAQAQYRPLRDVEWNWEKNNGADYINMGMMLMNKSFEKYLKGETPHQFLRRQEFKPFIDGKGNWKWSTDQTLLNWWIRKERMKIKQLDWKWNALYTAIDNDKIKEAHFVHFFKQQSLPHNGENIEELMKLVG